MHFNEIKCQDRAVFALQQAYVRGRVPHACIFSGPDGVGRFLVAQAWSALLLCSEPVQVEGTSILYTEACGHCTSCRLIAAGTHPDFQHVYKELRQHTVDGKGKAAPIDLPIDVIREFLLARVGQKPSMSQRRVFVVSEAEKLNPSGQNALLKVLEEPPPECCIVLLCTRLDKLLPTIRSRAQVIRFGPMDRCVIVHHLQNQGLPTEQAACFAGLSQGSLGLAGTYGRLAQEGADLYQIKRDLVECLVNLTLPAIPDMTEMCLKATKDLATAWTCLEPETSKSDLMRRAQKAVVQILISVWEDAMKVGIQGDKSPIHADQWREIGHLADRLGTEAAAERVTLGYEALKRIEAAANERLVFEWLLLKSHGSGILTRL